MKAKGIFVLAAACFVAASFFLLTEVAFEDEAPGPAIYGITYVNGVAKDGVLVQYTIEHGNPDQCQSYEDQGHGNYLVGRLQDWGYWTLEANYTSNDSLYCRTSHGYRQRYNPHADNVDLYLLFCDDEPTK